MIAAEWTSTAAFHSPFVDSASFVSPSMIAVKLIQVFSLSLSLSLLLIRASLSSRSFWALGPILLFHENEEIENAFTDFCCQFKFGRSQFDICQFI